MKYYKAILSHYCSFKFHLENGEDADKLVRSWVISQNKGEAKSDRLILSGVRKISEKEYNGCNWPDQTYYFKK